MYGRKALTNTAYQGMLSLSNASEWRGFFCLITSDTALLPYATRATVSAHGKPTFAVTSPEQASSDPTLSTPASTPNQVSADRPPTSNYLKGSLLMLAAMLVLPIMDGIAKALSARYPLAQVVWARYMFHLLAMLPLVLMRFGYRSLWPKRVGVQLFRGMLLLLTTLLFFGAISRMPLATALALLFVSPLIVTLLGSVVVGERVGAWRWVAVLTGFGGVLVILRPGGAVFDVAALLALGAGTMHGLYLLTTRRLAGSAPPLVTLGYTAVVGVVVMSVVVAFVWVPPTLLDLALMAAVGVLAAIGHFLVIKAFDYAPATFLAPLGYAEIIGATLVGFIGFGDFPELWTWVGIGVIVASGLLISLKEGGAFRAPRPGNWARPRGTRPR